MYVIADTPVDTPLIIPVTAPIVVILVAPELHMPPVIASVNVSVAPKHIVELPVIDAGAG